jgi:hypothetical protein
MNSRGGGSLSLVQTNHWIKKKAYFICSNEKPLKSLIVGLKEKGKAFCFIVIIKNKL